MEDSEISDQAIEWFACVRSDTVTEEQRKSFIEWLGQDKAHQLEFIEIVHLWNDLEVIKKLDFPELREFPVICELFPEAKHSGYV